MLHFLAESDVASAPVGMAHLVGLVVTLAGTVGGSIFGGVKWLGRHFDKLGEERAKERDAQGSVIEQQRKDYLAAMDRRDAAAAERDRLFTQALQKQEEDCARARQEEMKLVLRVAGITYPGDTGKFKQTEEPK